MYVVNINQTEIHQGAQNTHVRNILKITKSAIDIKCYAKNLNSLFLYVKSQDVILCQLTYTVVNNRSIFTMSRCK